MGVMVISLKTIAEVDVGKLRRNIENIKNYASPESKICAVIKADAYGHGAVEYARRAENLVDYFAVALAEEAVELRLCGINKPVLLLLPTDGEGIRRSLQYGVALAVENVPYLISVEREAIRQGVRADIHLKIETGMNRFGIDEYSVESFCRKINTEKIAVKGCFSHFYDPQNASETNIQYEKFMRSADTVEKYFGRVIRHISASGGICASRKYDLDMVRPGLLLYGYKPFESDISVSPILTVKAQTLKHFTLDEGEHLLYGDYRVNSAGEYSLIRAGYADGLRRNGKLTANNRCMDVCAVPGVKEDLFTVFDNAEDVAVSEGTIPYEILCNLTHRSHVIYKD